MIRYNFSREDIRNAIYRVKPNWLSNAAERTARFIDIQDYDESSSSWSQVKPIYMSLQDNKCVFCERKFESPPYGRIEFDLEHFRPKSSIKTWPPRRSQFSYDFETGVGVDKGYYWLAYEVMNYAASCKICNSTLKSNYFPIAGARKVGNAPPEKLASERPYLCYPIGDWDEDPENLITFTATTARPVHTNGHKRRRAEVIIDFFRLNLRQELHEQRAQMVIILGNALSKLDRGENVAVNTAIVEAATASNMQHAACSRAFKTIWQEDRTLAEDILSACSQFFGNLIGLDNLLALGVR